LVLLPPTLYSIKQVKSFCFIGTVHPSSTVEVEIVSYTNEKTNSLLLADNTGEWQLLPVELAPGK